MLLSVAVSTKIKTPWGPFPSKFTSEKFAESFPDALLIAASIFAFGIFSAFAFKIAVLSAEFVSGSGTPAFAATSIALANFGNTLDIFPHLFIFAAFLYSKALPIRNSIN